MVILIIFLYILIGCLIGAILYVFADADEPVAVICGFFWPISFPGYFLAVLIIKFYEFLVEFFEVIKDNGFHYFRGKVNPCCGQCKYIHELSIKSSKFRCKATYNECSKDNPICQNFKKDRFWRFKYRK